MHDVSLLFEAVRANSVIPTIAVEAFARPGLG